MAAAGAASILTAVMELRGMSDVVGQLRETAGMFDHLRDSADSANDSIAQIRNTSLSLGAGSGQVAAAAAAFQSIGLSMEQLRNEAQSFRERLFTDPITIGAFGRQVVPARLGGPSNELETLDRAIKMLRETKNAEDRLSLARRLGLQTLLPLADVEPRYYEAMRKEGERRGGMVDDELRTLRANTDAQSQRIADLRDERGLMRERNWLRVKQWWQEHITIPTEEMRTRNMQREDEAMGIGPRRRPGAPSSGSGPGAREIVNELRLLRDEVAGGGRRAAGAVPSGLRGHALQDALNTHALRDWGAFSLNE